MRTPLRWCGIAVVFLTVGSQAAVPKDRTPDKYQTLLARLKQGDKTVDFLEIRRAYADSGEYTDGSDPDDIKVMFGALNKGDFARTIEISKRFWTAITWTLTRIRPHFGPITKCTLMRKQSFTVTLSTV